MTLMCLLFGHRFGEPTGADFWNARQKCSRCPYHRRATIINVR